MDFQSRPSGEEDTTREDSQPTAANTPYHTCQEDQGVAVPMFGGASLRPPPEDPAVDPAGNSLAREERWAGVWSVLHRTREELEYARSRKDWGEELRQIECRVLGCEAAMRAVRRAMLLERTDVAPHPLILMGKKMAEESNATGQQELVKFLRGVFDVIETMMMAKERAGSERRRKEAQERMKRGLEIVAQATPRITDTTLVQRIQTFVGYYAGMLEA